MNKTFTLLSEEDTLNLAKQLSLHLQAGDCVLLFGPVGVGKSALARAIIQHQMARDGQVEDVPSPTFTLVQTYQTKSHSFCHADLYRLADSSELYELGFPEVLEDTMALIEWPERLGSMTPSRCLKVEISFPDGSDVREVKLTPIGNGWDWVADIELKESERTLE